MVWWAVLTIGLTLLLACFMSGMPIFVAFLLINLVGVLVILGQPGFGMVANSIFETTNFADLSAIPLFIMMGELLFRSGSIDILFDSVDKLVGKVKGRQYVLCIALSTIFGALSGAAMGVAAMMARTLLPGMLDRGYDAKMSTGAILAGASLAPIIPPSVLVIIIGTLANVSIAGMLIAGILPGLMLAVMFLIYTLGRVRLNPALAPEDAASSTVDVSFSEKIRAIIRVAPFALIIFCVMGLILLGIATPSESAATGVVGSMVTAAYYRKLNWKMISESLSSAAFIASMILVIMASSKMFSQLLAFTGSTRELTQVVAGLDLSAYLMLFIMMLIPFILCMFIDQIALMLVVIPIYQPLIKSLEFDPIFAFKGATDRVSLRQVFSATWPFVLIFLLGMFVIAAFPPIATFLPSFL